MLIIKCKDFSEAYEAINRHFIDNPELSILYGSKNIGKSPLLIELNSINADKIDLGVIGYKSGKWPHLLNSYVDLERLKNFYRGLNTSTSSLTYNFKDKDHGNGGCLRSITFIRKNKKEFNEIHVMWRTCQLETKFAADLILISKIIEQAPNTKATKIYFHMAEAFQSARYTAYIMEMAFGRKVQDLPEGVPFYKKLKGEQSWMNPESELCKRGSIARYQKRYWEWLAGVKFEKVTIKECELNVNI